VFGKTGKLRSVPDKGDAIWLTAACSQRRWDDRIRQKRRRWKSLRQPSIFMPKRYGQRPRGDPAGNPMPEPPVAKGMSF